MQWPGRAGFNRDDARGGDGIPVQPDGNRWDYADGDHLIYHAFGGEERHVVVTNRYADIKNDCPGFDAVLLDPGTDELHSMTTGATVWGYDDQIQSVHRAAPPA